MTLEVPLIFGVFFGFVAALMAFLIVYNEYQRHRLGQWRVWKEALTTAAFTFAVFFILSLFVGYWASHLIR